MSATIIPVLGNDYQIYAMQEDEDGLNEAADLFDSTDRLELRPIDVAWLLSQLPNTPDDSTAYPWLFSDLLAVLRWMEAHWPRSGRSPRRIQRLGV